MTAVAYERDARQVTIVRRARIVRCLRSGGPRSAHDLGLVLGQATQEVNADLAALGRLGEVRRRPAPEVGWSARYVWEVTDGQA